MIVRVTDDDIANGEPGSWYECPVAIALKRETGKKWGVSGNNVYATDNSILGKFVCKLPIIASEFISRFDRLQEVESFEFSLDLEG